MKGSKKNKGNEIDLDRYHILPFCLAAFFFEIGSVADGSTVLLFVGGVSITIALSSPSGGESDVSRSDMVSSLSIWEWRLRFS